MIALHRRWSGPAQGGNPDRPQTTDAYHVHRNLRCLIEVRGCSRRDVVGAIDELLGDPPAHAHVHACQHLFPAPPRVVQLRHRDSRPTRIYGRSQKHASNANVGGRWRDRTANASQSSISRRCDRSAPTWSTTSHPGSGAASPSQALARAAGSWLCKPARNTCVNASQKQHFVSATELLSPSVACLPCGTNADATRSRQDTVIGCKVAEEGLGWEGAWGRAVMN